MGKMATSQQKFDPAAEYVAVAPIYVGASLAYTKGDEVPAANVGRHDYLNRGYVTKVATKEGEHVLTEVQTQQLGGTRYTSAQPASEHLVPVEETKES
jgi:hypothetical protein